MPRRRDDYERFDQMSVAALTAELGEPRHETLYAEGRPCNRRCTEDHHEHWRQGDGRPYLADDDPAVMCAVGRCAVARIRFGTRAGLESLAGTHPARCGWCDYPVEELLLALDWATWHSNFVISETLRWPGYTRQTRTAVFEHPAYAAFDALPAKEQQYRVEQAIASSLL